MPPKPNSDEHPATRTTQCGEHGDTATCVVGNAAREEIHGLRHDTKEQVSEILARGTVQDDRQAASTRVLHDVTHGPGHASPALCRACNTEDGPTEHAKEPVRRNARAGWEPSTASAERVRPRR